MSYDLEPRMVSDIIKIAKKSFSLVLVQEEQTGNEVILTWQYPAAIP